MKFINLPEDILIYLFKNFLNASDLFNLSKTCKKFNKIINNYNIWSVYKKYYPIIDFNYPSGYDDFDSHNNLYYKLRTDRYKLKMALKWTKNKIYYPNVIYRYKKKMLPFIQIDEDDSSLFITDANRILNLKLNENTYLVEKENNCKIQYFDFFPLNTDVKGFIKKDDYFFSFSNDTVIGCNITQTSYPVDRDVQEPFDYAFEIHKEKQLKIFNEYFEINNVINSIDFSKKSNKLVYGCKNGLLKMFNINNNHDEITNKKPIKTNDLKDRILKILFSPSNEKIAIGTAGIVQHLNYLYCPLRLYNAETFQETEILMPSNEKPFRRGAGVLAISYIDENTLLAAGYDTFIRIFDLRSQNCVQCFEEPEDMAIYCVCCSKENGLLSGNDHFCLIRYWDRRTSKIVRTFEAVKSTKSPIYSLACSTETIFAGWEQGVTAINF